MVYPKTMFGLIYYVISSLTRSAKDIKLEVKDESESIGKHSPPTATFKTSLRSIIPAFSVDRCIEKNLYELTHQKVKDLPKKVKFDEKIKVKKFLKMSPSRVTQHEMITKEKIIDENLFARAWEAISGQKFNPCKYKTIKSPKKPKILSPA